MLRSGADKVRVYTLGDEVADGSNSNLVWYRGRACESGACVEVAAVGDAVVVRSSADSVSPPLRLSRDEWREFLGGAKDGDFDQV